jgi:hypothetical protein
MRYINHQALLNQLFADEPGAKMKARLARAHKKLGAMADADRGPHTKRNGPNKWKPVKDGLTAVIGLKCWYTEVELIGAPLAVDHYRPVCNYWWLTFEAENYRLACPWANSPEHNAQHGCAGGKGDNFPLLHPGVRATAVAELPNEVPVILDPCKQADCELLAFQADGRPVLNPVFAHDAVAAQRVEQSKILINLDHPAFNSKREQLCRDIADDVRTSEALPAGSPARIPIEARIEGRLAPAAPFSAAARCYLKGHRHLDWVEAILNANP